MSERADSPISTFENARRAGAALRAQNERKDATGFLVFSAGMVGLVATVWLTIEIHHRSASPFVWDAIRKPMSPVWWVEVAAITAYLFSYFFIGGLAFTVIYNLFEKELGPIENMFCSIWILASILWISRAFIESVDVFIDRMPSGLIGWCIFILWIGGGWAVFEILKYAYARRRSRLAR